MADFNNKLRVDFIANTDKFNRKLGLSEGKLFINGVWFKYR